MYVPKGCIMPHQPFKEEELDCLPLIRQILTSDLKTLSPTSLQKMLEVWIQLKKGALSPEQMGVLVASLTEPK
jgi:hypothetical protein